MPLKYREDHLTISDVPCPCLKRCAPRVTDGYRVMHSLATDADFVPVGKILGSTRTKECTHYALSFFKSVADARAMFKRLSLKIDVKSKMGGHIGKIELVHKDGICEIPDARSGHFDFHENVETNFVGRVLAYYDADPRIATSVNGKNTHAP